jgi:glycosyltransferase involved in cell wall biosynthesis
MKKVLLIAFHFPPDASVGAVRPAKFAKYLSKYGWQPIILTLTNNSYDHLDHTRYEPELNHLKIIRAPLIPGPLSIYSYFNKVRKLNNKKPTNVQAETFIRRMKTIETLKSLVRLPDENQGWIFNVLLFGYYAMKIHGVDLFVTSGPPMSTHLGGLLLKKLSHAKWLADFRDPWMTSSWRKEIISTKISDKIEYQFEKQVVNAADAVVSTTDTVTDYFKSILPADKKEKCITITNGFDTADFPKNARTTAIGNLRKITLTHAGTLYLNRDPKPFFKALSDLTHRSDVTLPEFKIDLIGSGKFYKESSIESIIRQYSLESVIQLYDKMPFQSCIERLQNSNALLLFAQGQPQQIPKKVFEYIKINRPILAITEDGETKKLLEQFDNAFIADPLNPRDIQNKLMHVLDISKSNCPFLGHGTQIHNYDVDTLTGKFAEMLDRTKAGCK